MKWIEHIGTERPVPLGEECWVMVSDDKSCNPDDRRYQQSLAAERWDWSKNLGGNAITHYALCRPVQSLVLDPLMEAVIMLKCEA